MADDSTGRTDPIQWARIADAFTRIHETQEARIQEEASRLGLDLDDIWDPLLELPDSEKLRRFAERNPEIDLEQLATADPYDLAVGVLRIFAEGD